MRDRGIALNTACKDLHGGLRATPDSGRLRLDQKRASFSQFLMALPD